MRSLPLTVRLSSSKAPDITSPTFWDNVADFFIGAGMNLLAVAGIIVAAFVIVWILHRIIHMVVGRIVTGAKTKAQVADTQALERSPVASVRLVQRTRTLGSILRNIVNVTAVIVSLLLILGVLAPNALGSLTLLTAAVGAGLGFGAQNIVKDVFNGIFIVAEDQIGIGDVIDLGLAAGVVESVSVRITQVRDVNGTLWYVRNGEVTRIGNMSLGWSRVITDLSVPADADIDAVEDAMLTAARSLTKDPKWRTRIVEQPEIWGLESIEGDTLLIRIVLKTRAGVKDDVSQELRKRLKGAMDELGVAVPQLNSVMLTGLENAGRVRGANPPKTKPVPLPDDVVWKPKRQPRKPKKQADPGTENDT